jgi:hypothetical protein
MTVRLRLGAGAICGTQMALGQVHHMDVVPHTGAIGRGVVVTQDRHRRQLAARYL